MFSSSEEAMPPKGLPGVFAEKNWPACEGHDQREKTKTTDLVRARRQVERHCYISNIARRALHNNPVILSRFPEQGQVRGVRLEGNDTRTSLPAGAAPYCV